MKKLLVSILVVLFLVCAADAAQPKISPDRINTSQPFPSILMDEDANITLDGGKIINIQSDGIFNVKAFGAVGDNTTDDAPAIDLALDAVEAAHGILYFPPGDYLLKTPQVSGYNDSIFLEPRSNVWLVGAGIGATTIRVTDNYRNQTRGACPIASFNTSNFVENWGISDMTIDFNGESNILEDESWNTGYCTISYVGARNTANASIERVKFVNGPGANDIILDGFQWNAKSQNCVIRDCIFENSGNDITGNSLTDHTTVYTGVKNTLIENCVFLAEEHFRTENSAAIEIHSPNGQARGNKIINYPNGIYFGNDGAIAGSEAGKVSAIDNIINATYSGIMVWLMFNPMYKDVKIHGNQIDMWALEDGSASIGIRVYRYLAFLADPDSIDLLSIDGNDIQFQASQNLSLVKSYGMYIEQAGNSTSIHGNVIKYPSVVGIEAHGRAVDGTISILDNHIDDFGRSTNDELQRAGIVYGGFIANRMCTIAGNVLTSDLDTYFYLPGVIAISNSGTPMNLTIRDNEISGVYYKVYPTTYPSNSTILVESEESSYPTEGFGGYSVGSIIWNTATSSGQPLLWACTTSGAPGTWTALTLS